VERSVKAGHSRYVRHDCAYGLDGGQGAWLVQWCEAGQSGDTAEDFVIDPNGARESVAAVDDPVANGVDINKATQPLGQTDRLGRSVPRVNVERGPDLVVSGDEPQLEGA